MGLCGSKPPPPEVETIDIDSDSDEWENVLPANQVAINQLLSNEGSKPDSSPKHRRKNSKDIYKLNPLDRDFFEEEIDDELYDDAELDEDDDFQPLRKGSSSSSSSSNPMGKSGHSLMTLSRSSMSEDDFEVAQDWLLESRDSFSMQRSNGSSSNSLKLIEGNETTSTPPLLHIMNKIPIYEHLPQSLKEEILCSLVAMKFKKGDTVYRQGEIGKNFYIVAKGEILVMKVDGGIEHLITRLFQGDSFGEASLLGDSVCNTTARIGSDSELLCLKQDDFQKHEEVKLFLFLRKIPMLGQLPLEQQRQIVKSLNSATYSDEQEIVRQGETADRFYILTKGSAEVVADGRKLCTLHEGNFFGEQALINKTTRNATVIAKGKNVICHYLTQQRFKESLTSNMFKRAVLQASVRRDRQRQQRLLAQDDSLRQLRRTSVLAEVALHNKKRVAIVETKVQKHDKKGGASLGKYVFQRNIGHGAFGSVKLCRHVDTGLFVAIKVLKVEHLRKKGRFLKTKTFDIRQEVAVMKKLSHPHIVNLLEIIESTNDDKVYLVQEYVAGGSLMSDSNEPLGNSLARKYFRDILRGLEYLHFQKCVHRDIKPDNLLVTDAGHVKIADFGAALLVDNLGEQKDARPHGTPAFMAPELFVKDQTVFSSDAAIDIWALGATLYMLLVGCPPWTAKTEITLVEKIKNEEVPFPATMSPSLRHLISFMMEKDPTKRASLVDVMAHDWTTAEGLEPMDPMEFQRLEVTSKELEFAVQELEEGLNEGLFDESDDIAVKSSANNDKIMTKFAEPLRDLPVDMDAEMMATASFAFPSQNNGGGPRPLRRKRSHTIDIVSNSGDLSEPDHESSMASLLPNTPRTNNYVEPTYSTPNRKQVIPRRFSLKGPPQIFANDDAITTFVDSQRSIGSPHSNGGYPSSGAHHRRLRTIDSTISFASVNTVSELNFQPSPMVSSMRRKLQRRHTIMSESTNSHSLSQHAHFRVEVGRKDMSDDDFLAEQGDVDVDIDLLLGSNTNSNTPIASPTQSPRRSLTSSHLKHVMEKQDFRLEPSQSHSSDTDNASQDAFLEHKKLSRKQDFMMVTSTLLTSDAGTLKKRAVVFRPNRNANFSVVGAFKPPTLKDTQSSNSIRSYKSLRTMIRSRMMSSKKSLTSLGTRNSMRTNSMSSVLSSSSFASDEEEDELFNEDIFDDGQEFVHVDDVDDDDLSCGSLGSLQSGSEYSDVDGVGVDDLDDVFGAAASDAETDNDSELASLSEDELPMGGMTTQVHSSGRRSNPALRIRYAVTGMQGPRQFMEDKWKCIPQLNTRNVAFFGVYDGHNGSGISSRLAQSLHTQISISPAFPGDLEKAISEGSAKMDKEIIDETNSQLGNDPQGDSRQSSSLSRHCAFAGSTAVVAMIYKPSIKTSKRRKSVVHASGEVPIECVVACVGDSLAVVSVDGEAELVTKAHTTDRDDELERIQAAGGWVHNNRVNGVLAVTRSFGDVPHKCVTGEKLTSNPWKDNFGNSVVTAQPDFHNFIVTRGHEFLIIASDGLWDVLSPQQAVNFVRRCLIATCDVKIACNLLIEKAMALGSHDNTSAIVVCLNQTEDEIESLGLSGLGELPSSTSTALNSGWDANFENDSVFGMSSNAGGTTNNSSNCDEDDDSVFGIPGSNSGSELSETARNTRRNRPSKSSPSSNKKSITHIIGDSTIAVPTTPNNIIRHDSDTSAGKKKKNLNSSVNSMMSIKGSSSALMNIKKRSFRRKRSGHSLNRIGSGNDIADVVLDSDSSTTSDSNSIEDTNFVRFHRSPTDSSSGVNKNFKKFTDFREKKQKKKNKKKIAKRFTFDIQPSPRSTNNTPISHKSSKNNNNRNIKPVYKFGGSPSNQSLYKRKLINKTKSSSAIDDFVDADTLVEEDSDDSSSACDFIDNDDKKETQSTIVVLNDDDLIFPNSLKKQRVQPLVKNNKFNDVKANNNNNNIQDKKKNLTIKNRVDTLDQMDDMLNLMELASPKTHSNNDDKTTNKKPNLTIESRTDTLTQMDDAIEMIENSPRFQNIAKTTTKNKKISPKTGLTNDNRMDTIGQMDDMLEKLASSSPTSQGSNNSSNSDFFGKHQHLLMKPDQRTDTIGRMDDVIQRMQNSSHYESDYESDSSDEFVLVVDNKKNRLPESSLTPNNRMDTLTQMDDAIEMMSKAPTSTRSNSNNNNSDNDNINRLDTLSQMDNAIEMMSNAQDPSNSRKSMTISHHHNNHHAKDSLLDMIDVDIDDSDVDSSVEEFSSGNDDFHDSDASVLEDDGALTIDDLITI